MKPRHTAFARPWLGPSSGGTLWQIQNCANSAGGQRRWRRRRRRHLLLLIAERSGLEIVGVAVDPAAAEHRFKTRRGDRSAGAERRVPKQRSSRCMDLTLRVHAVLTEHRLKTGRGAGQVPPPPPPRCAAFPVTFRPSVIEEKVRFTFRAALGVERQRQRQGAVHKEGEALTLKKR